MWAYGCVQIRGQPSGVGPLIPPHRSWGSNSGRSCWHAPLLAKPFLQPHFKLHFIFIFILNCLTFKFLTHKEKTAFFHFTRTFIKTTVGYSKEVKASCSDTIPRFLFFKKKNVFNYNYSSQKQFSLINTFTINNNWVIRLGKELHYNSLVRKTREGRYKILTQR